MAKGTGTTRMRMQTTATPTPGPWMTRSYPHTLDGERWYVYVSGGGVWVPESMRTIAELPAGVNSEANARLIAEAPAMLALLRRVDRAEDCLEGGALTDEIVAIAAETRALLARAKA